MRRWKLHPQPFDLLTDHVHQAASQAQSDRLMLAWALTVYRKRHHLTEGNLADWLELSRPQLATLALCVRPDVQLPGFGAAVERIASASGCPPERLTHILYEAALLH